MPGVRDLGKAIKEKDKDAIIKVFKDPNLNINSEGPRSDFTPLAIAIQYGTSQLVALFLAMGANPNAIINSDRSVLSWAVESRDPEKVRVVLEYGAKEVDPNKSSLKRAIKDKNADPTVVKLLLDYGFNPHTKREWENKSALDAARKNGRYDLAELMESYTFTNLTVLFKTKRLNVEGALTFLLCLKKLDQALPPYVQRQIIYYAFHLPARTGVIKLIGDEEKEDTNQIIEYVEKDDIKSMEKEFQTGLVLSERSYHLKNGKNVLKIAASNSQLSMARLLIQHGAIINFVTERKKLANNIREVLNEQKEKELRILNEGLDAALFPNANLESNETGNENEMADTKEIPGNDPDDNDEAPNDAYNFTA